ncbi:MAG TPA: class I SAM-dependent methyltransferase [Vicinamibacterales bacterium]|nr:class I SAM-dependent methyltransferase [Vicinamibacterales bacterium]
MPAGFVDVPACWVCEEREFDAVHEAIFDLSEYTKQDPELAEYTGARIVLQRCRGCGFTQPAALPSLPNYFDRMYDQRWSDDWIVREHEAPYKDRIFADILASLRARAKAGRALLDVGAHAGRFLRLARREGWDGEGLELNPRTAAYAAQASGAIVHQGNIHTFNRTRCYDAVTLTDVLEHVPQPMEVLRSARSLLCAGGWIAVKVPNGHAQRFKENLRARLRRSYRATLADNLVHVNHFSAASLRRALSEAGFRDVTVQTAVPELPEAPGFSADRMVRLATYYVARVLPGGAALPISFNLQAYGRRS